MQEQAKDIRGAKDIEDALRMGTLRASVCGNLMQWSSADLRQLDYILAQANALSSLRRPEWDLIDFLYEVVIKECEARDHP